MLIYANKVILTAFLIDVLFLFLLISCFEGDPIPSPRFSPRLLEPKVNHVFQWNENPILFRWVLDEKGKILKYKSCAVILDGETLATLLPEETSFRYTPYNPLHDGIHTWKITVSCEGGISFSAESTFVVNNPPSIKNNSLDNLQAYIDDYLLVAIEFNEPMHGIELNKSITIDNDASLSEIETEDQTLYYFKVRNFEWNHSYRLSFNSTIKNYAENPLKPTSLRFHTPQEFPQPKAIGWIGGGKDGWQTENGPFEGGSGDREFSDAQTITLAKDEKTLYIADPTNNRVQRWTSEGIYQGWIGGGKNGWQYGETPSVNKESPNQSTLNQPSATSNIDHGFIYIINRGFNTIHKWDLEGNAIAWLAPSEHVWQREPFVVPGRSNSSDLDNFALSASLGINSNGEILFVDDRVTYSIINKWSKYGGYTYIGCGVDGWQTEITCSGIWDDNFADMRFFSSLRELSLDRWGNIYVGDNDKEWVIKWSKEGKAIGWIGHGRDGWQTGSVEYSVYGEHDLRSFSYPIFTAIDSVGNLFITDGDNHRVCKWTKDGKAIGWIGHGKDGWQTVDAPEYWPDSDGKGNMEYNRIPGAEGIAVDSRGTIYVSGTASYGSNWRVSKWVMDDGDGGGGTPVEE